MKIWVEGGELGDMWRLHIFGPFTFISQFRNWVCINKNALTIFLDSIVDLKPGDLVEGSKEPERTNWLAPKTPKLYPVERFLVYTKASRGQRHPVNATKPFLWESKCYFSLLAQRSSEERKKERRNILVFGSLASGCFLMQKSGVGRIIQITRLPGLLLVSWSTRIGIQKKEKKNICWKNAAPRLMVKDSFFFYRLFTKSGSF